MNEATPELIYIDEPKLTFGYNQVMQDPRDGITLFGPHSRNKVAGQISIGIIGPGEQSEYVKNYLKSLNEPIFGKQDLARPYFPGLEAAYGISVNFDNIVHVDIARLNIDELLKYTDGHQRVFKLSNLYAEKLIKYSNEEHMPVTVWFVALPDEVYQYGRPKSKIPASEDNIKDSLRKREINSGQAFLFDELNQLREAYDYEINFHNQLKAKLLPHKIITQLLRESTIAYQDIWNDARKIEAERIFDTAKAWNIATTLYYKAGGLPWKLGDVREGICYLGLVYKKINNSEKNNNACCAAQMFLDSGDGMVFRGNIGPWYNPRTEEFHISRKDAAELISQSLEAFKEKSETGSYPKQVFIHAKTFFDDDEWNGFLEAANGKSDLIGVRIRHDSALKLYRNFAYCIPRGTALLISDTLAYLWTKGFIPRLQTQLGLETPNPVSIEITRGKEDIRIVCKDILALTKLNYNACIFADGNPVTLRFADAIGEILTAGRAIKSGILPFKHYV